MMFTLGSLKMMYLSYLRFNSDPMIGNLVEQKFEDYCRLFCIEYFGFYNKQIIDFILEDLI